MKLEFDGIDTTEFDEDDILELRHTLTNEPLFTDFPENDENVMGTLNKKRYQARRLRQHRAIRRAARIRGRKHKATLARLVE